MSQKSRPNSAQLNFSLRVRKKCPKHYTCMVYCLREKCEKQSMTSQTVQGKNTVLAHPLQTCARRGVDQCTRRRSVVSTEV
ncbi:hypothetical protein TNCV_45471 [Trichonephila clavipes]|nr:hypothetical protein TNCV_45471 [Trichonephila clavipes]